MVLQPCRLSEPEFNALTRPLRQQPVVAAEKGYGSAFTLFFGAGHNALSLTEGAAHFTEGAATLDVEWDWRLELNTTILCGSSDSRPVIADGIAVLIGQNIAALNVCGTIPELEAVFTSGHILRTMAAAHGQPAWSIQPSENLWITPQDGQVWLSTVSSANQLTAAERQAIQSADAAARRWQKPATKSAKACCDCRHFIRLDGDFALLDYGVCSAPSSDHDGHVTYCYDGCSHFEMGEEV